MDQDHGLFLQQNAADTLLRDSSPLQVLLSMGFPKNRALKALAATGNAGVQVACDWIFAHVKDPELDVITPRDYILYACPTGPLGAQLDDFWKRSLGICRNGVHNSFPHVTLCSFFKCNDELVGTLVNCLESAVTLSNKENTSVDKIGLEYFSTPNYVGLFLDETTANYLRKVAAIFANSARKSCNIEMESYEDKQLHMTLAYKFPSTQFNTLESLAQNIKLNKPSHWELRLYSRNGGINSAETLKVIYPLSPSNTKQLQLINGDYIYVMPDHQSKSMSSTEGWMYGTSWLTGCSGYFLTTHTEKISDTETWTLHKTIQFLSHSQSSSGHVLQRRYSRGADEFHTTSYTSPYGVLQKEMDSVPEDTSSSSSSANSLNPPSSSNTTHPSPIPPRRSIPVEASKDRRDVLYSKVNKKKEQVPAVHKVSHGPRRVYVFRHAERVDITFSKQWIQLSFDDKGNYHRKNLNMPKKIPKRAGGPNEFKRDTPLTEMGLHQAFLTGQALKDIGANISHVYSSPALRCVETANGILRGLGIEKKMNIKIELGLWEWMKWSPGGLPAFLPATNLSDFGINIEKNYKAKFEATELPQNETSTEYFDRCHTFITNALKETEGDLLICGHAGSLDGLTRQLRGLSARNMIEFVGIVTKIPYCGSVVVEELEDVGIWELIEPPFPTLTHAPNPQFNWKLLLS